MRRTVLGHPERAEQELLFRREPRGYSGFDSWSGSELEGVVHFCERGCAEEVFALRCIQSVGHDAEICVDLCALTEGQDNLTESGGRSSYVVDAP